MLRIGGDATISRRGPSWRGWRRWPWRRFVALLVGEADRAVESPHEASASFAAPIWPRSDVGQPLRQRIHGVDRGSVDVGPPC